MIPPSTGPTGDPAIAPSSIERMPSRRTATSSFGSGKRESHDASAFYARFVQPVLSDSNDINPPPSIDTPCITGDARSMAELADNSVALVVTSPPYFVGKDYEDEVIQAARRADDTTTTIPSTYADYLTLLNDVFAECRRVLEPGGRIAVNVANLGRKPYRSLSSDVTGILEGLGLLLRGEILWQKARGTSGSCAWGSFKSPANPVLRDTTERVIVASKGRFDRAISSADRKKAGLPWRATVSNDEFLAATLDVWELPPESARRVNHPAPFPVDLPRRLIELYTFEGDVVLDPFMGSGTSLVAAVTTGRIPIGYDVDPDYVEAARRRLAETEPQGVRPELADGKRVHDVAATALRNAGFKIIAGEDSGPKARVGKSGVVYPFLVEADTDEGPRQYYVDVAGGFTSSRPGLTRSDVVWKVLAQAHVANADDDPKPVIVLSPELPGARTEGGRLLRAVGPNGLFDILKLYDTDDEARLAHYGAGGHRPMAGFWSADDVETYRSK